MKFLKRIKQKLAIKNAIREDQLNKEAKNETKNQIKEKIVKREGFVYEADKYVYNFLQYETIRSLAKNVLMVKLLYIILIKIKVIY